MRFTLIGPVYPYRGGIAHFTTELALALKKHHHDVRVISFKRQYPKWLYPGESDREPGRQTRAVEAAYLLDSLNPLSWWMGAQAAVEEAPDAVIMAWWTTFFGPMNGVIGSIVRRAGVQLIYIVHNALPHEPRPWDAALSRYALGKADRLLALSRREQERLKVMFPDREIDYTPLPVYTMFPANNLSQKEARQQLGLPEEAQIALFFGLVRPYKGLTTLLESLLYLRKINAKFHIVIAGEFWDHLADYQQYIQENRLDTCVTIHPKYVPNERVATYFLAADAFAAPYTSSTQSAAIKTALGFGIPIAASEAAVEDADVPKDYPLFPAPANDPQLFAAALNRALHASPTQVKSPATWKRLIQTIETFG